MKIATMKPVQLYNTKTLCELLDCSKTQLETHYTDLWAKRFRKEGSAPNSKWYWKESDIAEWQQKTFASLNDFRENL